MGSYPVDWLERAERVRDRDKKQCAGCGRSDVELHVHHIVPLAEGGSNSETNLITLCRACHQAAHSEKKHPVEYAPRDSCYFCSNCDRYYSIEFGRKHGEKCPTCESKLMPWIGENRV